MWEKNKILAVGDLVYHILYGKGWLGIIIEIEEIEVGLSSGRASALVHMVPGSEYGSHFDKAFSKKEGIGRGWVTTNWLVKIVPDLKK